MIVYRDIIQGTPEWFALKAGKPSAGSMNRIVTSTGKVSDQREAYLNRLAGERILGRVDMHGFKSESMDRGTGLEPEARDVFSMLNDVEVEQVGFITDDLGRYGCSPDGMMPDSGLEIKCPELHTFVGYAMKGFPKSKYGVQVQGNLFVTGLQSWIFFAYYPEMKPFQITVEPDLKFHAILKEELERFLSDLDKAEKELRERN